MKVIDLLNKIANGEEVPNKIKYNDKIFIYDGFSYIYENKTFNEYNRLEEFISYGSDLNDEVEIIKDNKKIEKIEKIEKYYDDELEEYVAETFTNNNIYKEIYNSKYDEMIIEKLNELIDEINKLKEDK